MSNLQFSFDGRRDGKSPEKSNFRQTCNILSQFMKGKGTLTDLNFGIPAKSEVPAKPDVSRVTETATMDFLTYMEKPSTETKEEEQGKPIESVPRTENCREMEVAINEPSTSKEAPKEPKLAQLTMFYDGKVMVFDDFPADRARAMMLLATKGNPHSSCGIFQTTTTTTTDKINTSPAPALAATTPSLTCNNTDKPKPDPVSAVVPQQQQVPPQTAEANNSSDLPIARRSSLHRFLAKRKDRAVARAPYQVHQPLPSSSKNEESSSKAHEDQIDLNFKESSSKAHEDQIDLNFTL